MAEAFQITLAGLTVEVRAKFPYARAFCRDYLRETEGAASVTAQASEEEMEQDRKTVGASSRCRAEVVSLYRSIAEQLPALGRFVCHGAAISYGGRAYLFLAPSGTGKSTHICLWRQYIGCRVGMINGDKPVIDASGEVPLVCGTPWAGKEGWQRNVSVPLGGVCLLRRGETDRIRREKPGDYLGELMNQVYRPEDPAAYLDTLTLMNRVFEKSPFYVLDCTPTENAVKTAFPAMTGEDWPRTGECVRREEIL